MADGGAGCCGGGEGGSESVPRAPQPIRPLVQPGLSRPLTDLGRALVHAVLQSSAGSGVVTGVEADPTRLAPHVELGTPWVSTEGATLRIVGAIEGKLSSFEPGTESRPQLTSLR